MGKYNNETNAVRIAVGRLSHTALPMAVLLLAMAKFSYGGPAYAAFDVLPVIDQVKLILTQIGPALSAVLFVLAGVFYALGQLMPPEKKAQFHTTAVNIIIGAIVVGVLSVASASLADVSSHLLSNLTVNGTANSVG